MPDTFPAFRQADLKLSEQIRALRREIADTRSKRRGLDIALSTRMNKLARLEAKQVMGDPFESAILRGPKSFARLEAQMTKNRCLSPARIAMACS